MAEVTDQDAIARAEMVKTCAAFLGLLFPIERSQGGKQRVLDALMAAWWEGYKYGKGADDV